MLFHRFSAYASLDGLPLDQLVSYIDWSPFFQAWELKGKYPKIFEDEVIGSKAKELFADAQTVLDKIVKERLLTAKGVYGFFPANSTGDDIVLYTDDTRTAVWETLHTLRQQIPKVQGQPNMALADFVAPQASGVSDYVGAFAVTAGIGVEALCQIYERDHDDYSSIMVKALADRLAEAFAEWTHKQVRDEWGYGRTEQLKHEDLIQEQYRGIRPAPGYPACPDHTENETIFRLLDVEKHTGMTLTESFTMYPAASVSGLYFSHPQAAYFAVGKIGRDQVVDYQRRKGKTLQEIERWLRPALNYDPDRPEG